MATKHSYITDNSMATKYMNRFAIEEDDQFEIHVKDYTNETYEMGRWNQSSTG